MRSPLFHSSPFLSSHLIYLKLTNTSRYKIGDTFIQLALPDAQSLLASSTEDIDAEVGKLEDSLGELRDELGSLKAALYARFGRSINLEA